MPGLFTALAKAFDGDLQIERTARAALFKAAPKARLIGSPIPLPDSVHAVLAAPDAHPACQVIAETPLPWAPPQTSTDPAYIAASVLKVHVELVGPDGFVPSDKVRLGLYGMQPGADYGIRTHPAEEVFVMLAGRADWKQGDAGYATLGPGERSYHPSMLPHATRTTDSAFMSLYVWSGDVSTDGYSYLGHLSSRA